MDLRKNLPTPIFNGRKIDETQTQTHEENEENQN
jgi:hypothetical protein